MIVPPPAGRGATIGVVATAGAVDPAALERGLAQLRGWGFEVRVGAHVLDRRRYCAGEPRDRVADLEAMFRDPSVAAVLCARGGYGTAQILPLLDPALFTAHPKLLCGYSDVSPLLGFLVERCRLVALHGPMIASEIGKGLTERSAERLRSLLLRASAPWREATCETLAPGVASGRLVGGCLSSLVALLGTPYAVETANGVLFLEDVAERPYRIDRMLTQLRLAGKLDDVRAVILGSFADCDGRDDTDVAAAVFHDVFRDAPYPVVAGFPAGHLSENVALALGMPVTVNADEGWVAAAGDPEPTA
jgi:muramoyltetrapeptide carboxypeptidase